MQVVKFTDALISKFKDQGIKFLDLANEQGEKLITKNQNAKDFSKKVTEIKNRIKFLEPGIYILGAYYNANPKIKFDRYFIGVGDYKSLPLAETQQVPVNFTPAKKEKEIVNVLSYESALKNIQEIESLKAENARLLSEVENYKKQITTLEETITELESDTDLQESGTNTLAETIKSVFTPVMPLVPAMLDQFFTLQNRKLDLAEKKLDKEPSRKNYFQKQFEKSEYVLPLVNDVEGIEKLCTKLDAMPEEQFNAGMQKISEINPELYAILDKIYFEEEEEQTETN